MAFSEMTPKSDDNPLAHIDMSLLGGNRKRFGMANILKLKKKKFSRDIDCNFRFSGPVAARAKRHLDFFPIISLSFASIFIVRGTTNVRLSQV